MKKIILAIMIAGFFHVVNASPVFADRYFNSAEAGCDPASPNPDYLMCEDFETSGVANSPNGHWYGEDCDTANANGGVGVRTKGWCGTIFANPITPAGAAVCGGAGFGGTLCAATSGLHAGSTLASDILANATSIPLVDASSLATADSGYQIGIDLNIQWTGKSGNTLTGVSGVADDHFTGDIFGHEGDRNQAQHSFVGEQKLNEIYWRAYFQPQLNYNGGHEKMFSVTTDGQGAELFTLCYNYFGTETIQCIPYLHQDGGIGSRPGQPAWMEQNMASTVTLVPGNWYYIEIRVVRNTPGSFDGIFQMWHDDCGAAGDQCTGTPTLRTQFTDVLYLSGGESLQIGGIWFENWANAPTIGEIRYDQTIASKAPIGFMAAASPSGTTRAIGGKVTLGGKVSM